MWGLAYAKTMEANGEDTYSKTATNFIKFLMAFQQWILRNLLKIRMFTYFSILMDGLQAQDKTLSPSDQLQYKFSSWVSVAPLEQTTLTI